MNILLCPAKIILQHQRSEWAFLQRNTPLVFATCSEHRIDVMNHLGDLFVVRFYDDFNDNPMVELDLYDYAKCHPVKEVHFLAEVDVLRAARINDRLGLTHQSAKEALYFRDKFLMKSLVQQYQVAIPEMALVKNATDIALFIETHGYPSVIKPTDGRGSQNVVVIRNDNQLKACLQMITPLHFHNLLIERFIEGHAYQINGLYLCGRPIFISASRANVSCLDFLSGESLGLVMECNSYLLQQLTGYTRYLLEEIFPTPNDTLFHLEVFVDKSQHIIFGELACRLGGCFVNEELGAAFGLDPRMTWLDARLNQHYPENLTQRSPLRLVGQLNVPPQNGTLVAIPQECPFPFVLKYRVTGVVGQHYDAMKFTNGEVVSAIVEGRDSHEVNANLCYLANWVEENTRWTSDI